MKVPKYVPVHDAPFSPAELVELQARLEDTEPTSIGGQAAARLLASVQRVEQLLLAMVEPVDGAFPRDEARAYLTARGLLPVENITEMPRIACYGCAVGDDSRHKPGCGGRTHITGET